MRKLSKKKGPVKAKKVSYDGIDFASGLEKYMYKALKEAGIETTYEGECFELIKAFQFANNCTERQSNSKGDYINRGNKKILNIKYTPDFTSHDYIIETKGRANEAFPMRWKLFKRYLSLSKDTRDIYKPQRNAECDETVRLILMRRKQKQQ
jgi:hypothetical protein